MAEKKQECTKLSTLSTISTADLVDNGPIFFFSTLCYDGRNGKRWPGGAENGGKDEVRDGVGV